MNHPRLRVGARARVRLPVRVVLRVQVPNRCVLHFSLFLTSRWVEWKLACLYLIQELYPFKQQRRKGTNDWPVPPLSCTIIRAGACRFVDRLEKTCSLETNPLFSNVGKLPIRASLIHDEITQWLIVLIRLTSLLADSMTRAQVE